MNNKLNKNRRQFSGLVLKSLAALPFISLIKGTPAQAQDLPQIALDDPVAVALKYVHDATTAERPDKGGVAGGDQTCANCLFIQGEDGQEWRPCQLFPGKSVADAGWCISWTVKP